MISGVVRLSNTFIEQNGTFGIEYLNWTLSITIHKETYTNVSE